MFVRPRDKERETWTGRRAGIEGAMIDFGADNAYTIDEFERVLPRYLDKVERVYYPLGHNEKMNERVLRIAALPRRRCGRASVRAVAMLDPRELIHEARLLQAARRTRLDAARDGDFGPGPSSARCARRAAA